VGRWQAIQDLRLDDNLDNLVPYDPDSDESNPSSCSDRNLLRKSTTGWWGPFERRFIGQFSPNVWMRYCSRMKLGVIGGVAECEKLLLSMAHDRCAKKKSKSLSSSSSSKSL